jgi:hypothetical protein
VWEALQGKSTESAKVAFTDRRLANNKAGP